MSGVDVRIHGNNRYCTFLEQRQDKILEESSSSLVNISAERHTVIKITVDVALEITVVVCPNMSDGNIRHVNSNLIYRCW